VEVVGDMLVGGMLAAGTVGTDIVGAGTWYGAAARTAVGDMVDAVVLRLQCGTQGFAGRFFWERSWFNKKAVFVFKQWCCFSLHTPPLC